MGIWHVPLRGWVDDLTCLDPQSIKGKLLINFVDKLIIGVLAAIVICCVQSEYLENKKFKEMAFEKTKLQTDFIVAHQKELTGSVGRFIGLIFDTDVLTSGKLNGTDGHTLRTLLKKIRTAVFHLQALNQKLAEPGETLVGSASLLCMDAISGTQTESGIKEKLNALQASYSAMLKEVRQTTRDIMKREYEGNDS